MTIFYVFNFHNPKLYAIYDHIYFLRIRKILNFVILRLIKEKRCIQAYVDASKKRVKMCVFSKRKKQISIHLTYEEPKAKKSYKFRCTNLSLCCKQNNLCTSLLPPPCPSLLILPSFLPSSPACPSLLPFLTFLCIIII